MRLETEFPKEWKEKSQRDHISLADILYGYAVEDIMQRINKSSFYPYLWLINDSVLGESAYKKAGKNRLEFFYVESEKKSFQLAVREGDPFGNRIVELMKKKLFSNELNAEIQWECFTKEDKNHVEFILTASFMEMKVPLTLWIENAKLSFKKAKERTFSLLLEKEKTCSYFSYAKESILAEDIFEIMRKLELISDMECYDRVNEFLKKYSVSGRYIIDNLRKLGEKEPKIITEKRLRQISSYKTYGYMKKRWKQYTRYHRDTYEEWEDVMTRVETFIVPVWTALCKDEVFFDDWMPELERFLG